MSSDPFSSGEPEYLGDAPSGSGGTGRPGRAARVGVAAAGVVGVVALGGWAALSLMSGGPQPDEAVPATALAYASIDLDPSAGQKLEAVRILEKFPALDEKLGLDASDDLRRWVFEESGLAECPGVDYEEDVEPWIGERAAVAVLPGAEAKDRPSPVLALQVTDGAAAADALGELLACEAAHGEHGGDDGGGPEDHEKQGGFAVGDGYVLLAESTAVAQAAVDAASAAPLAEDDAFARWTEAAGEPGIMTFYVAPDAPAGLAELQRSLRADEGWTTYGEPGELPGDMPGGPPFPVPGGVGPGMDPERVAALTVDFEGWPGSFASRTAPSRWSSREAGSRPARPPRTVVSPVSASCPRRPVRRSPSRWPTVGRRSSSSRCGRQAACPWTGCSRARRSRRACLFQRTWSGSSVRT